MKKIISILLASTMLFSFTAPTFAADSSFSESCGHIENPTRFNPTELSEYQQCWVDFYKADEVSGMVGNIFWMRLGDDTISITRDEIRAGGKGVIRSAIEQWVVDNQVEAVAARITAAEDRVEELSADLEEALAEVDAKSAEVERIQAQLVTMTGLRDGLQADLNAEEQAHSATMTLLNGQIDTLTADLMTANSNLMTANTRINDLTAALGGFANALAAQDAVTVSRPMGITVSGSGASRTVAFDTGYGLITSNDNSVIDQAVNSYSAPAGISMSSTNGVISVSFESGYGLMTDNDNAAIDNAVSAVAAISGITLTSANGVISLSTTLVAEDTDSYTMTIDGTEYTVDSNADVETVYRAGVANTDTSHNITIGNANAFAVTADASVQVRAMNGNIEISTDAGTTWATAGTYSQIDDSHNITIGTHTFSVDRDQTISTGFGYEDLGNGTGRYELDINGQPTGIKTATFRSTDRNDYAPGVYDSIRWSSFNDWEFAPGYGLLSSVDTSHDVTIGSAAALAVTGDVTLQVRAQSGDIQYSTDNGMTWVDAGTYTQRDNAHAIQIGSRTFNFLGDSTLPIRAQNGNIEVDYSGSWQVIGSYTQLDASHDVTIGGHVFTVTADQTVSITDATGVVTTVNGTGISTALANGYGNTAAANMARMNAETALGDLQSDILDISGPGVNTDTVATRIGEIQGALNRLAFIDAAVPTVQNVAPDLDMDGNPDGDDYNNDRGTTQISVDTLQTNGNAGTTWGDAATLLSAAIESSTFVGMHRGRPQAVTIDVGLGVMETYNIATLVDNLVDTVWEDGYNDGYADGYDDGFDDGYAAGYTDGVAFGRANP